MVLFGCFSTLLFLTDSYSRPQVPQLDAVLEQLTNGTLLDPFFLTDSYSRPQVPQLEGEEPREVQLGPKVVAFPPD